MIHPVVIVGAGPTGITAATLLSQHNVPTLVLERWPDIYPQPRAVHLDDEIYRILARLGVADEFAAVSRPAAGLRLVDRQQRVLAQFDRSGPSPRSRHPRASMFGQPELEQVLRTNLKRHPLVTLRSDVDVTSVVPDGTGLVEITCTNRATGLSESLTARYVLGCDGANSLVRASIGAQMTDLGFEQRWLVIDVETAADLDQWDGVHQLCDPERAGTYMRIGETRYRWEFQLEDAETPADFADIASLRQLLRPWIREMPDDTLRLVRVAEYTFRAQLADRWRTATSSSSETPPISRRRSSGRAWAPVCAMPPIWHGSSPASWTGRCPTQCWKPTS